MRFLPQAARYLARQETKKLVVTTPASKLLSIRTFSSIGGTDGGDYSALEQYDHYGKDVFAGRVADEYLSRYGLNSQVLKDPTWVKNHADNVASAVFDW